jgi:diguanylate cyclase
MKYSRERAASAEILRLVLQKMASQPAAFTPPTYAVWYEFATGINPALNEAMNKLLDSNTPLDDDTVEKLYAQYVSECSTDVQQVLRDDIKKLLSKVAGFTAETDRQATSFGSSLQSYGDALKGNLDASELGSLISGMAGDTDKMRGSMQQMQAQLEASKQEVEKLNQQLESARGEALTDPLTGVLNRRGFETRTQPIFSEEGSSEKGLCLLMLDIDHFKKINDTYGHLFGDKVISAVAGTIKSKVKGQDAIARLGGEEFAVLLPETNLTGAFVVAEQIRQSIQNGKIRRQDANGQIGGITISIGVAAHAKGSNLTELLDRADKALYTSKQGGRNRTTVFGQ